MHADATIITHSACVFDNDSKSLQNTVEHKYQQPACVHYIPSLLSRVSQKLLVWMQPLDRIFIMVKAATTCLAWSNSFNSRLLHAGAFWCITTAARMCTAGIP
jgi:hypothetical protein